MLSLLLALGLTAGFAAYYHAPIPPSSVSRAEGVVQILDEHNLARREVGAPPLVWNDDLAGEAQAWARQMAREGVFHHSPQSRRADTGENLWMGTAGHYSPRDMIGAFLAEKQHYRHGRFPNVSSTGNWSEVGHYTQIVWEDTREVGCGLATGHSHSFLVCRYWPAGNVMGQYPF